MNEPWTRQEQINYATFGTRTIPPEFERVWDVLRDFATATAHVPGTSVLDHFAKFVKRYNNNSMSVDQWPFQTTSRPMRTFAPTWTEHLARRSAFASDATAMAKPFTCANASTSFVPWNGSNR